MKIGALIVDDQDDIRLLIRMIIEAANEGLFVSGEAADGHDALDALEALDHSDPHVVVLDEMMPGMSGVETATRILERRPEQRIILCSAYLDEALRARAMEAGVSLCLTKSEVQQIPEFIRRVMA